MRRRASPIPGAQPEQKWLRRVHRDQPSAKQRPVWSTSSGHPPQQWLPRRKQTLACASWRRRVRSIPKARQARPRSRTVRTASLPPRPSAARAAPTPGRREPATQDCSPTAACCLNSKRASHPPRDSGSGLCDETAKPPLALLIFANGGFERRPIEIGPIRGHKYQLAVCRLPEQEIGEPLFATRTDDEIGVGNVRGIQKTAEQIHIDIGKAEFALLHGLGNALGRPHDLLSGSIVKATTNISPSLFLVSSSASTSNLPISGSSPVRSPITRTRTLLLCSSARSFRTKRRRSPMSSPTSLAGRDQFSALKEKIVTILMPISPAARIVRRSASTPRRCPSARGSPRPAAQRPWPSIMIATCRGTSKAVGELCWNSASDMQYDLRP